MTIGKARGPRPGDIYLAVFPEHDPRGHEQEGQRPTLVLAVPSRGRFPVMLSVPMTTDHAQPWIKAAPHLYIKLPKGTAGLPSNSVLLLDQARALDSSRIQRFVGTLGKKDFETVLSKWLALFER